MKKISVFTSVPAEKKIRGYAIKRMPIGAYLRAVQVLEALPSTVLSALFPDEDAGAILSRFARLDKEGLQALFVRALTVLPEQLLEILSVLFDVPKEKLMNDPTLGLDGLCELLDAWITINGIENFIKAAGALWEKVRKMTSDGSKS